MTIKCTLACPAMRVMKGDCCYYCRVKNEFVCPVEKMHEFGFDVIRDGKIVKSGHYTQCDAPSVFGIAPKSIRKPNHSERNSELMNYLKIRIATLKSMSSETYICRLPEKKRETARKQLRGRILELVNLRKVISRGEYEQGETSDER